VLDRGDGRVRGDTYEVPFPYETGVVGYPAAGMAARAGAPGEIDDAGAVRRVSVVPRSYTKPHPGPVFVATSKSPETIVYCAERGFIPTYFMPTAAVAEHSLLYVDAAANVGMERRHGELQNVVRWPHITPTAEEYDRRLRDYDLDIYKNFYGPFFPQFPNDPDTDHIANMKASNIFIGGTVSQSISEWQDLIDQVPTEFITLIWHYAQIPKDEVAEELTVFMEEVLPSLEVPDFEKDR
jgi:hypothetical protein